VVIGKSALFDFVPLYWDYVTENIVTQYTARFLENCGLVKIDFLSCKALDIIKYSEELIRHRGGEYANFDIKTISESGTPEAGVAYSIAAYQTAYLKANFPAEFMAATMTNAVSSVNKISRYIDEARKMGIAIDPPNINRSDQLFTVAEGRIVYGFLGIKGLGNVPAEEITNCRKDGPYKSFMDFLVRVYIQKQVIELLILTGAFDGFEQSREVLLGNLKRAIDYAQNIKDNKEFGQPSLLSETGEKEYADFEFKPFGNSSRENWLRIEKEHLGCYFSEYPKTIGIDPDYTEAKENLETAQKILTTKVCKNDK
jgi:DNA polymerase-3 subunit alpha